VRAWLGLSVAGFLARDPADSLGRLAAEQQARGFAGSADQGGAWEAQIAALREALAPRGAASGWTLALEYELLRLEKRADAVLLTDRAILCLEFKTGAPSAASLAEAEDYALDLRDFHAGSRAHAIVPVLVAGRAPPFAPPAQPWLLPTAPTQPLACPPGDLGALLDWVQGALPPPVARLDGQAWLAAPYRPVPNIVEAATMLYARHGVAEIAAARADAASLQRTARAVARHVERAREEGTRIAVFVTGIPGAGKTLCGLNTVFGPARQDGAAFLTGNASLVAVLREALARDAARRTGRPLRETRRPVEGQLQNVHRFLEDCATDPARLPPERLIVFDEAQRAWDEAKAREGTRNRRSRLTRSEPAHTLEIMSRRPGWSVVVALIGNGQEINTGEAGLAEWGRAIAAHGGWRAAAAPEATHAADPVQRLAEGSPAWLDRDTDLHLGDSLRGVREPAMAGWADAVVRGARDEAAEIASRCELPCFVVRDLAELRAAVRALARGRRRAGLVRSAGARRLRAEGLSAEVSAKEVADWFLNRWPDVRASDALEAAATEYACQALELDVVGLAWGGDFRRGAAGWEAFQFSGDKWQRAAKDFAFVRNTYRVLLTRARYETVVWVPRGSLRGEAWFDATRDAEPMDRVADFLLACGARAWVAAEAPGAPALPTLL